jgi:hypothetical protein
MFPGGGHQKAGRETTTQPLICAMKIRAIYPFKPDFA